MLAAASSLILFPSVVQATDCHLGSGGDTLGRGRDCQQRLDQATKIDASIRAASAGDDRGVETLIAEALAKHPSVSAQASQVKAAKEGVELARWQYYPSPSISVESVDARKQDQAYGGDENVAIFTLQQPLWTWGRLSAGVDRAKADSFAALASWQDVQYQVALRVIQAYGDWLAADFKRNAWIKNQAIQKEMQGHILRRIEGGVSALSDNRLAEGRLLANVAEISVVEAQIQSSTAKLGELVGRNISESELSNIQVNRPPNLGSDLDELLRHAEDNLPAIKKAGYQIDSADASIRERNAAALPELYMRYEHQRGNYSYTAPRAVDRVFVGFSTHFGAGLSRLSEIKAASARREFAYADREAIRKEIKMQILSDFASLQSMQKRITNLENSLLAEKEVSDSYFRQFLAGKRSWLDLMNSARELVQTEVQLGDARAAAVVISWRLYLTVFGGYQTDTKKVQRLTDE